MSILEKLKDLIASIEEDDEVEVQELPGDSAEEPPGSESLEEEEENEEEEFELSPDPEDPLEEEEELYAPDSAVVTWEDLEPVREARSVSLLMQQELGRLEIEYKISKERMMQQYARAQVKMREGLQKVRSDLALPESVKYRFSFPKEEGLNGIFEKLEE